jgi:hypothetical protein
MYVMAHSQGSTEIRIVAQVFSSWCICSQVVNAGYIHLTWFRSSSSRSTQHMLEFLDLSTR